MLDKSILKGYKRDQIKFNEAKQDLSDQNVDHPNKQAFMDATAKADYLTEAEYASI